MSERSVRVGDDPADGRIVDWANEASALVGYKNPAGQLLPMFMTQGRPSVDQLTNALRGHVVERDAVLFPRDRRSILVRYRIELSGVFRPTTNLALDLRTTSALTSYPRRPSSNAIMPQMTNAIR